MADGIQINKYIKSLGLSGKDAEAKRIELYALSDAELTALLSGKEQSLSTKKDPAELLSAKSKNSNLGTSIEKNKTEKEQTVNLASGRKIVIKDGSTKFYAADGTQLNKEYFEKQEGVIDIKQSGRYSVTKAGQTKYYAADGTQLKEAYFKQVESSDIQVKTSDGKTHNLNKVLENRINSVTTNLENAEKDNGFIGKAWSGFKNLTGIGDSSDKVREQQDNERKLLAQFNSNEQTRAQTFKELTGVEYTEENLQKFVKGEIKLKSEMALQGYKEGQEMATDVAADMVSGIASVGIYAAAVAAAPVTGGASIAVGLAAATASGAAIKTGVKAADALSAGKEYSLKDAAHDAATGAFSGVLAPVTGGMGGAVGKTVATKMGIQAVKQIGKEVAADTVEAGVKQGVKSMLTNPTGYEYVGGTLLKRGVAQGAEMATDGAVGGAVDNAFRTAYDGGSLEEVANSAVEGFVGGAIMSPLIGGGMKAVGKLGHELGSKLNNDAPNTKEAQAMPDAPKALTSDNNDFTARYIDENSQINHINMPDEGIPSPTPKHVTEQPDGTKILTPEGEKIVRDKATELHNAAADKEAEIVKAMQDAGFGIDKETMTHRAKSEQSIYDKVSSAMTDKKYPASFEKAVKGVYDAVGTRTQLDDFNYKDHPDIVEVYKTDPEKAYKMAAERQSAQFAKNIENLIIQQAQRKSEISAAKISNYMGKDGIPYLSKEQIEHINFVAAQHGVDLNIKDPSPKVRPSGYTAYQMNFTTKDGFTYEWQLRGSEINEFAECEHVPYDIRQGKDVTGGRKELEPLYKPIEDVIHNLSDDQFNRYNDYLTAHYKHLRKLELGFDSTAPKLEDYGDFGALDKRLSAESLEALHDTAVKLKDGKVSEETALKLYNDAITEKESYFQQRQRYTDTEKAEILSKYNLTPDDIKDLGNNDVPIAYLDMLSNASPEFVEEVTTMPKEDILLSLKGIAEQVKAPSILTRENLTKLMKDFDLGIEEAGSTLLMLSQNPQSYKYINNLIKYSKLADQKLNQTDLENLAYYDKKALKALSPERLEKIAYVAKELDIKLNPYLFDRINDIEKITPDFVQKLKKEYDTIRQNGLEVELGNRDFTADYAAMKKINDACEKYDISFGDIKSTYYSEIEELVNLENFDKVAEFIKRLSPEAKASNINLFYNILAKEKGAVKLEPDDSLAELYNSMAKIKDNYHINNEFVNDLSNLGIQDFSGPAKLLDAFAEIDQLPSPFANGSNMAANFVVANGDYDGAAKYIRSLKPVKDKITYYMAPLQDTNFDFNKAAKINNAINERGLLPYFQDYLKTIYKHETFDIDKFTDLVKFIHKEIPALDPTKTTKRMELLLNNAATIPSLDKIKQNYTLLNDLLNRNGIQIGAGYNNFHDIYKFLLNDIDSDILSHNAKFLEGYIDKDNITGILSINKKLTKENFIIDGKSPDQLSGAPTYFFKAYNAIEKYPDLLNDFKKSALYSNGNFNINTLYNALNNLYYVKNNVTPEVYNNVITRDLLSLSTLPDDIRKLAEMDNKTFNIYNFFNNTLGYSVIDFYLKRATKFSVEDISILTSDNLTNIKIDLRASVLEKLNNLPQDVNKELASKGIDINMYKTRLAESLGVARDVITPAKAKQTEFLREIVANNNQQAENVLKTLDFAKFNTGIPLKYPRAAFNQDIETLLSQVQETDVYILRSHFKLEKGEAGFEGLPVVKELTDYEKQSLSEKGAFIADKIAQRINDFTLNNEVLINDKQTKEVLDALIQGLPEFTTIVGKKQHGTHAYTVDIHTLKVLQSAMNDPMYKELSDQDKTILKIAALLHDTGKKGGVIDRGHASLSSDYARAVLSKFQLSDAVKTRITDIVENHHWFEQYNTGQISAETMAANCRRPEDFKISVILAKSDLSNVNPTFHFERTGTANQAEFDKFMFEKTHPIEEKLHEMQEKANIVFDTQFTRAMDKFPTQKVNIGGNEVDLKVLNLTDDNITNLEQYGFAPGTTRDNARFTVHMTSPKEFPTVEALLANTSNKSTWSTSLISLDNNRTYTNRKFGFILDVDKPNVAEAYYQNLGSGYKKDINSFTSILFDQSDETRTFVRDGFIEAMKERGVAISLQDYAQLSKYIFSKKYTTQIKNVRIGDKVYNAEDLVYAFEKSRDALFQGYEHSEIVSINPRIKGLIARVSDINDVPQEFLNFANKKNLPIILIGFKNP